MTLLSPRTFSLLCEPVTLLSPVGPLVFYIEPMTLLSPRTLSLLYEPMTLVFYRNYDHTLHRTLLTLGVSHKSVVFL